MRNKQKIVALVAATMVLTSGLSQMGWTSTVHAQSTGDMHILPFKLSEALAEKLEKASPQDTFACIVAFDKHLDDDGYAELTKQIGPFPLTYRYEHGFDGVAGSFTKAQIQSMNNLSYVKSIELDGQVTTGDDIELNADFSRGFDGWRGGFADYPEQGKDIYRLNYTRKALPKELDKSKKGLYLSGVNRSDDLFMFVKKKVNANLRLKPNTTYAITFDFDIATNAGKDGIGVGGAPGESVYVKIGATAKEPVAIQDKNGFYQMNIDKGNQKLEGKDAFMIGNVAKTTSEHGTYELKPFTTKERPFIVKTDDRAELWLFIATDSGFESETSIYIPRIKATLKEVKETAQ